MFRCWLVCLATFIILSPESVNISFLKALLFTLTKASRCSRYCGAGCLLCAFGKYLSSGETMVCSFNEFAYKLNMQCPQKFSRRCRCRIFKNCIDLVYGIHCAYLLVYYEY